MAIILAIDTASPSPAVALAAGSEVFEEVLASDRRASEELLPAIARVLARAARRLSDCERLAVCSGPGSFTGVRIGLATAWGLSRALGVPIEPLSTLEAMAEAARNGKTVAVLAALDAGRGEASAALYDLRADRAREVDPPRRLPYGEVRAAAPEALLVALPAGLLAGAEPPRISPAHALALAVARSPREAAETLSPIYSRMSAAEEKRGPAPH
jgi:tRNA threonylcarbamoyladenosine biosynthesis protein TsaB